MVLYDQILFGHIKAIASVDNRIFVFLTVEQKPLNFEEFNNVKNKSLKNTNQDVSFNKCSFELIN